MIEHLSEHSALLVEPKQPFLDWILANEKGITSAELVPDPWRNVYLIPGGEPEEAEAWLEESFPRLFATELGNWFPPETWPDHEDAEVFAAWLRVERALGLFEDEVDDED